MSFSEPLHVLQKIHLKFEINQPLFLEFDEHFNIILQPKTGSAALTGFQKLVLKVKLSSLLIYPAMTFCSASCSLLLQHCFRSSRQLSYRNLVETFCSAAKKKKKKNVSRERKVAKHEVLTDCRRGEKLFSC